MLEYRRAWQAKALNNNTLLDETNEWLQQCVESFAAVGLIARPQFIRRPERSDTMQLLVARDGQLHGLALEREQDLHSLDLVSTQLPEVSGPQYFVCTNAKRDVCCAKFGRPTFAALHREVPDRAWQTTHVGGHRYAPNVLSLPQGALYGRVMADDVPRFLQQTECNEIAREFLRGQTLHSKVVQTAEHALATRSTTAATNAQLLRETDSSATFATDQGIQEVIVTSSEVAIEILPSCGKSTESTHPLIAHLPRRGST